jgi:GT2 family glycosyltransferase
MTTDPNVSIVVIAHNEEKNIEECLRSLILIDYPDNSYEIIVVDSSTDRTKEIVAHFDKVKLITVDDKGFSIKRNIGIREAKSNLIAFIDADCIVPSDWLKKIMNKISRPRIAAVASDVFPPPDSPFFGKHIACLGKPAGGAIGFDASFTRLPQGIDVVGTGHTLFKKSVLLEVGGFNEHERLKAGGEDREISQRIIDAGYILEYEPDTFIYHKTRNVIGFLKWSFRHGISQNLFYHSHRNILSILGSPFSFLWPLLTILLLLYLPIQYSISILLVLFITLLLTVVLKKDILPSGRKKLKLLIERREKIGINIASIIFVVVPLFYIDRFIMQIGQLASHIHFRTIK